MQDETTYPSKWTVAAVVVVILLLIGGVFVWAFVINYGTLIVRADRDFQLEVNGSAQQCEDALCQVKLPPGNYDVRVSAPGYYDQTFQTPVPRWTDTEKNIVFRLIPFVETVSVEELPQQDDLPIRLAKTGIAQELRYSVDGQESLITTFESLEQPELRYGGKTVAIVDQQRVFFVDLETGRKQRRFGESVLVKDAKVSSNGLRTLLFVEMNGDDQLWLWFHQTDELSPLTWYQNPELVQWDGSSDHIVFAVTNELRPTAESLNLLDEVLESAQLTETPLALVQINLDTGTVDEVISFQDDQSPVALITRQGRLFVEYASAEYQEVVVR